MFAPQRQMGQAQERLAIYHGAGVNRRELPKAKHGVEKSMDEYELDHCRRGDGRGSIVQ
jgi:hypothetical protein